MNNVPKLQVKFMSLIFYIYSKGSSWLFLNYDNRDIVAFSVTLVKLFDPIAVVFYHVNVIVKYSIINLNKNALALLNKQVQPDKTDQQCSRAEWPFLKILSIY